MAYNLSPVLNEQQFDANGEPRAGALITTYLAGTLTAVTTYKTSTGTAHTNPIQLDSSGNYPNGTQLWLLGGLTYKFVITDSDGSNSRTYDDISGIGDNPANADEWILYGATPTYVSATSFSVIGDQTNIFQVNRRVKSTNTGGTVYSTVSASAFLAGVTTVTVVNTSGVLDSGLSAVSYGLLSATNPSIPETPTGTALRTAASVTAARETLLIPSVVRSYLSGFGMSTAGSSTTMSIAAGSATDSTNTSSLITSSTIAKTTSNWAVGTATGGKSLAAAIANSTWYHFYAIRRPDTGVVDVCFSTNATGLLAADFVAGGGNVPDAYTQFRRIGSGLTNGSAQWTSFQQDGDLFQWLTPVLDVNATNPGTSAVTRTLSTPLGLNVIAEMIAALGVGSASTAYLSDLATVDLAPSQTVAPLGQLNAYANAANSANHGVVSIRTNTSSQIRSRLSASDASTFLRIATTGWVDRRGKDA